MFCFIFLLSLLSAGPADWGEVRTEAAELFPRDSWAPELTGPCCGVCTGGQPQKRHGEVIEVVRVRKDGDHLHLVQSPLIKEERTEAHAVYVEVRLRRSPDGLGSPVLPLTR